MSTTHLASRFQILAAAFLFSTGGVAIKSCALSSWQVACFRCGVAAVVMWIILPQARQRWTWRIMWVGVAYAATLTLYVLANKATTAANAIFLQSTAPLYVLLLAPWLLGERRRRRDLMWMAGMAVGLGLFFVGQDTASATAPDPSRGNLYAAAAGLSWALTVMGLRWVGRAGTGRQESAVAVVAGNCLAFLICLPMALQQGATAESAAVGLGDWLIVVYLGVFQIAAAYVLLTRAIIIVSAFEAALLLLVDPVLSSLWAWWIHHEVPGAWSMAGGMVVLVVATLETLSRQVRPKAGASMGQGRP